MLSNILTFSQLFRDYILYMYIGDIRGFFNYKGYEEKYMATNVILKNYKVLQDKKNEDEITVSNLSMSLRAENISSCPVTKPDISSDYRKILSQTTLSMNKVANSYYKNSAYLDIREIDQIKDALNNFALNDARTMAFKREIIDDLSDFQKQIKSNYVEKIANLNKQKQDCERQIKIFEFEKNKLIMDRLSKILWPYDQKTKKYDNDISALQAKVTQYTEKIASAQQMRPLANEKDILIYTMRLKNKYSKIFEVTE